MQNVKSFVIIVALTLAVIVRLSTAQENENVYLEQQKIHGDTTTTSLSLAFENTSATMQVGPCPRGQYLSLTGCQFDCNPPFADPCPQDTILTTCGCEPSSTTSTLTEETTMPKVAIPLATVSEGINS